MPSWRPALTSTARQQTLTTAGLRFVALILGILILIHLAPFVTKWPTADRRPGLEVEVQSVIPTPDATRATSSSSRACNSSCLEPVGQQLSNPVSQFLDPARLQYGPAEGTTGVAHLSPLTSHPPPPPSFLNIILGSRTVRSTTRLCGTRHGRQSSEPS